MKRDILLQLFLQFLSKHHEVLKSVVHNGCWQQVSSQHSCQSTDAMGNTSPEGKSLEALTKNYA